MGVACLVHQCNQEVRRSGSMRNPTIHLSVCVSIYPCICLSVCLSIDLFLYPSIHLGFLGSLQAPRVSRWSPCIKNGLHKDTRTHWAMRALKLRNAGILGVPNASGPMADAEGRKRHTGPLLRPYQGRALSRHAGACQETELRAG